MGAVSNYKNKKKNYIITTKKTEIMNIACLIEYLFIKTIFEI